MKVFVSLRILNVYGINTKPNHTIIFITHSYLLQIHSTSLKKIMVQKQQHNKSTTNQLKTNILKCFCNKHVFDIHAHRIFYNGITKDDEIVLNCMDLDKYAINK